MFKDFDDLNFLQTSAVADAFVYCRECLLYFVLARTRTGIHNQSKLQINSLIKLRVTLEWVDGWNYPPPPMYMLN